MTAFSVLDLAPVVEGGTAAESLANSLALAQATEAWGYNRYWIAEHHNIPGIASSATSVVIGHIAGGTNHIRVGAGGIMLPNHSPLIIAEQFGTLASLYPDRIDLGVGRAPGTDQVTWQALRRHATTDVNEFPRDVVELQHYLKAPQEGQRVVATPGAGTNVPIWILGSSLFGAQLAGMLGLPFAFASHFAPAALDQAIGDGFEKIEVDLGLARVGGESLRPLLGKGPAHVVNGKDDDGFHVRLTNPGRSREFGKVTVRVIGVVLGEVGEAGADAVGKGIWDPEDVQDI